MRAHFCPDDAGTPAMPKDGEGDRGSPAMCRGKNEDSAEAGRSCDALVAALAPRARGRTHWHSVLPPTAPSSCPCSIALASCLLRSIAPPAAFACAARDTATSGADFLGAASPQT